MLLTINTDNPDSRKVRHVAQIIRDGGVIVYPTDTAYGFGCDIFNKKAVERIYQIKQASQKKLFSMVCYDISQISQYALLSDWAYRFLRAFLPGPFTLVMNATEKTPRTLHDKRKQVGVRMPENNIAQAIVKELGTPLLSATVKIDAEDSYADPWFIHEDFGHLVDVVIDGGYIEPEETTVVDLTADDFKILRQGKGKLDHLLVQN